MTVVLSSPLTMRGSILTSYTLLLILVNLKPSSDFGIFGESISSANNLFKVTELHHIEQDHIMEIHLSPGADQNASGLHDILS